MSRPRGSVARRGTTWTARIDVGRDPITGQRRQRTKGGFATEALAEAWLQQPHTASFVATEGCIDPVGIFVYALYGDSRTTPLYVGQTANIFMRLGRHYTDSRKRPDIRRISLLRCATRHQAIRLERELIQALNPPWNKIHNQRRRP